MIAEFAVAGPGAGPYGITTGPDGGLWLTLVHGGGIARLDPASGAVATYPLDAPACAPSVITGDPLPDRAARPHAIAGDPDGGCWFTEWAANRVGYVSPTGDFRHYDLPSPGSEPHGVTIGPDGGIWAALETGAAARVGSEAGRPHRIA